VNKKLSAICALLSLCAVPIPTSAGPYGDTMAKCLVSSTTSSERTALVQWMFATAALHPDVRALSVASDADRERLNKGMGALLERLLINACLSETKEALRYEGNGTIEASFNVLGQVAGRELFAAPSVASSMADFAKYVDEKKLKEALAP